MAAIRGRAFLSDHLLGAAAFRNSNGFLQRPPARRMAWKILILSREEAAFGKQPAGYCRALFCTASRSASYECVVRLYGGLVAGMTYT